MKIKDLFERVINILNDNFYSIITKIDNIFVSAKELKTSIDKIKNDVYNIWSSLQSNLGRHRGTHYVLINPIGELNDYFFNDENPDSELKEFHSEADIKVGETLYAVNNYYEEATFKVIERIYSPSRHIMFLKIEKTIGAQQQADWWINRDYFNFKDFVIKQLDDKHTLNLAKNYYKRTFFRGEENTFDDEFEKNKEGSLIAVIVEMIEETHRTILEHQCLVYKVSEIVYEHFNKKWKRPSRYNFSDF